MRVRMSAVPARRAARHRCPGPRRLRLGQQRGRHGPQVHARPDRPRRRGRPRRRHDRLDLDLDHGDGHDGHRHHRHDDRPGGRRHDDVRPPRPRRRPRPRPRPPAAARAATGGTSGGTGGTGGATGGATGTGGGTGGNGGFDEFCRRTRAPARGTERPRAPATGPRGFDRVRDQRRRVGQARRAVEAEVLRELVDASAATSASRCRRTCRGRGSRATTCPRRGRPRAPAPTSGR